MALHKDLGLQYAHVPYAWQYADSTARTGATGLLPEDIGKLARQVSDNSLWMLTDDSPVTWVSVTGSGGGGGTLTFSNSLGADLTVDADTSYIVSDYLNLNAFEVILNGNMEIL